MLEDDRSCIIEFLGQNLEEEIQSLSLSQFGCRSIILNYGGERNDKL